MTTILRQAGREDIAGMHRVRLSVRENPLMATVISEQDYQEAIETSGRGWVIESAGTIVAFAVGNAKDGSIWALFVDPAHEGRGYGRQLHDVIVAWLRSRGIERLWLTTTPGTRADRFYRAAGWQPVAPASDGETRFELEVNTWTPAG